MSVKYVAWVLDLDDERMTPAHAMVLIVLADRVRQRDVTANVQPQPGVGPLGRTRAARVDHVEAGRIGRPVHITTGRKISEGLPDNVDDVIVMLDAECSFRNINDPEMNIYWGAYIGTEDEILVYGNLKGLVQDIERIRKEAKGKKGWIMDTYLLRKTASH